MIDPGDDLPEGLVIIVDPGAALPVGEIGVGVEVGPADEEGAVDEQEVIADILGLGGDARERFDQVAEEHGVGAEEGVGVVPDVEAELGCGPETEGLSMAEKIDDTAGPVDAGARAPGPGMARSSWVQKDSRSVMARPWKETT